MSRGRIYYTLYGRLLEEKALNRAFKKVKSANGSAGVDGQSIKDFNQDLEGNVGQLQKELQEKSYTPLPVLRVEIEKEGGGTRKLGIPAVRDRVVQQALLDILQPIFEEDFHPSSYGYRPGRSCHQAITKSELFIRKHDLDHVVDMDLSKCFDTLDHEQIIRSFRKRITDGSILNLLRKFLESGVQIGEDIEATKEGSPQGGVISPLIANVYLNEFDQEMKRRGHRIVRYADDLLVFKATRSGAENALKQATAIMEDWLKLTVNRKKTHLTKARHGVKFLGVVIHKSYTRIAPEKVKALKARVKRITRRNSPVSLIQVIGELNPIIRGFAQYFRIANCKNEFRGLMQWMRRRLRAKQLKLWKKPAKLHKELRRRGYKSEGFAFIRMSSWRNANCKPVCMALPNRVFDEMGLFDMSSKETGISVPLPE